MSGTPPHVHNLTDVELYQELLKHGFPAGPVVASNRNLYQCKLSEILEGSHGHGTELTPDSQSDSVRSRKSLSHTYSTYSGDVAEGRSSAFQSATSFMPSREQGKDEMRAHSSVSSSYLGTERGDENYEGNSKASPSWLSHSSTTQPRTSPLPSRRTYGLSGDEAFGKSRYRTTLSDTSPAARQEMASQYRSTGLTDEEPSLWNRHNPERQRNKSFSPKGQFGVFVFVVLVAIIFCYRVHNLRERVAVRRGQIARMGLVIKTPEAQCDLERHLKTRSRGCHKSKSHKSESEEYDSLGSDSDTEQGTSSCTESSNHLDDPGPGSGRAGIHRPAHQNFLYHTQESSMSTEPSPISERRISRCRKKLRRRDATCRIRNPYSAANWLW